MKFIQKLLFLALVLSSGLAFGQLTEDPDDRRSAGRDANRATTPEGEPLPFQDRLRFGGGISSLQFGNANLGTPFIIGLSPVGAYQLTERLVAGVGINYVYYRYRLRLPGQTLTDQFNQYGGRSFVMYEAVPSLVPNLNAHVEFEGNNIRYRAATNEFRRRWVTAPLVGVTYSQRVGRLSAVNISALYNTNFNADVYSRFVYGSPWVFRISFF